MSAAVAHPIEARRLWKVEDLDVPEFAEGLYEIWEGELIEEARPSNRHNNNAIQVVIQFMAFCEGHNDLYLSGDNDGFIPARDPDMMLSPDAALYRIRPELPNAAHHAYAPEIAVEVVSPSNSVGDRMAKRLLHFKYGTEQVWEIFPESKTLEIYFREGRSLVVRSGVVKGEGIAEGLAFDLEKVFAGPFA